MRREDRVYALGTEGLFDYFSQVFGVHDGGAHGPRDRFSGPSLADAVGHAVIGDPGTSITPTISPTHKQANLRWVMPSGNIKTKA